MRLEINEEDDLMSELLKLAMDGQEDICVEFAAVSGGKIEKFEPDRETSHIHTWKLSE